MVAFYDHKPSPVEAVGNGSYLYRYNITEVEVEASETASENAEQTHTQWQCDEVVQWGNPSSNAITEAVISERWPANYEQKLVNEYNAANLGLVGGSKTSEEAKERIAAYKDFLESRAALKQQVDTDCETLGID